eukprot:CAMPEP_0183294652 /NCGR_PEP_ID=MMETSP0160_2-20130417/2905_1 /TAXON_ID=2839 ORGANISM="Odontella Sinensis, Strain Grunow 1884" /NCGR_SAMPLE_ID=MMETSP0160_2 /ASSEMBLY_ACC=CAM_ASM_000250 /LENGTH=315 /DNA_ID=CAMNT_0025456007 /DNA_START=91 /DNA_END=1039 /DNA_ORIENTATION=+
MSNCSTDDNDEEDGRSFEKDLHETVEPMLQSVTDVTPESALVGARVGSVASSRVGDGSAAEDDTVPREDGMRGSKNTEEDETEGAAVAGRGQTEDDASALSFEEFRGGESSDVGSASSKIPPRPDHGRKERYSSIFLLLDLTKNRLVGAGIPETDEGDEMDADSLLKISRSRLEVSSHSNPYEDSPDDEEIKKHEFRSKLCISIISALVLSGILIGLCLIFANINGGNQSADRKGREGLARGGSWSKDTEVQKKLEEDSARVCSNENIQSNKGYKAATTSAAVLIAAFFQTWGRSTVTKTASSTSISVPTLTLPA